MRGRTFGIGKPPRCLLVALAFVFSASRPAPGEVLINEILAANRLTNFDEDGDSSDWVELYNPDPEPRSLKSYFLSDDARNPYKWVFPNVTIPARGYLLVWASGKDRYLPPPESIAENISSVPFEPNLIPPESEWEYLISDLGSGGPPPGWNLPGASGGGFTRGRAGFGYGDEDDTTELPAGTTAVFIRKSFRVEDPSSLRNLILQVDYDDGFVAYLNGTRVASANGPPGNPDFSSVATASHEAGKPERFNLTPFLGLLRAGENVLALVGLNVGATSSDLSLHPQLGIVPLVIHTNFALERAGEVIYLTRPDGRVVDACVFPPQNEDHSYGRLPGEDTWRYFLTPTPGAPNAGLSFADPISSEVEFRPPGGKYSGSVQVALSASPPSFAEIRYTTDGSEPTAQSALYTSRLSITRNTVIRAAAFVQGQRSTRVTSHSYFIGSSIQFPILSISMNPEDYATIHNTASGTGRAWERPAYMEFFEADGKLGVVAGAGFRLHGGAGRGGDFETKKAYKLYFRREYGDKRLRYRIIPETPVESFDKLVLRSGFNDCFRTHGRAAYIRDELIRDLHEDMGALASHGSWCLLYVNMKFRGLYNIVERMDEDFLSSYLEGEDWDVIKTGNDVLVGSIDEWNRLRNFIAGNDMSNDALYQQAIRLLDLENFTGYMILNMWAQNHDWPHNNWYAARRRVPDGKWIFLCWDAEFGIGLIPEGYSTDSFDFTVTRDGYIRDIFDGLLKSPKYRAYFMKELERHLAGALHPDNVIPRIRALRAATLPAIQSELSLFGVSLATWNANVSAMETFARQRGDIFYKYVANSARYMFPIDRTPIVTAVSPPSVVNVGGVRIAVSGLRLTAYTRFFFNELPAASVRRGTQYLVEIPFTDALNGPVTIRATNPDTGETGVYPGLLEVKLPRPRLDRIVPETGSPAGGEVAKIHGAYFLDGAKVLFGETPAPHVAVSASMDELTVVTPAGSGLVSVRVVNRKPSELPSDTALPFRYRGTMFVRGDANIDGAIDLSDALSVLEALFLGRSGLPCAAAADVDASRSLDISDAIGILAYLFLGGEPPARPFPRCDYDPDPGGLPCETGPKC